MLTKDNGLCLRSVDYSETSQVLTFFTQFNGKVSVIAKGSRRAKSSFGTPIEILSSGAMIMLLRPDDRLGTLTEFEQTFYPSAIRGNLSALNSAFFAAELISLFTIEHDPHPELYTAALRFISDIQSADEKPRILSKLILFELTLLRQTGSEPMLNYCVNCRQPYSRSPQKCFFSSSAGGFICRDCQMNFPDRIEIQRRIADCLADTRTLLTADIATLLMVENLLINHITAMVSRPPKMTKMLLAAFRVV